MSNYLIELSCIHMALALGYWFFLRNERQYAKMRFYLIAATLFALAIPLVKLPAMFFNGQEPGSTVSVQVMQLDAVAVAPATNNYNFLIWIYAAVSAFLLIKFLGNILHLMQVAHLSHREKYNDTDIRKVRNIKGSFTFFNWIFLSDEITRNPRDYDLIVNHEKAHAALGHSYDIIFFELFKVCFWWIPSAWFINREIRKIHEYQADAYALRSCNAERYSSILIRSALKSNGLSLASSFHGSFILKRLAAMQLPDRNVSLWKFGTLSALCALLFVGFACSEESTEIKNNDDQSSNPEEEIYVIVESLPGFEGGMEALNAYVASELKYPKQARMLGVEGRVDVQFVVEKDGSLSDVKAVKGIGAGCDAEAVRVVQNAPPFKPGTQQGKPVRVQMEMPIIFKLDKAGEATSPQDKTMVGDLQTRNSQFRVDGNYANGEWSGTVYDEAGDGLPGVNIIVTGTTSGTVSDADGHFQIKAQESQVLTLSFVGYESVKLEGKKQ